MWQQGQAKDSNQGGPPGGPPGCGPDGGGEGPDGGRWVWMSTFGDGSMGTRAVG